MIPEDTKSKLIKKDEELFTADFHYPSYVTHLFKSMDTPAATAHHIGTGLAGEGGEILDITKKAWVYGKEIDLDHFLEELGDIRFYYQAALNFLGVTDEMVIASNVAKLEVRYPTGKYSDQFAIDRLDKPVGE